MESFLHGAPNYVALALPTVAILIVVVGSARALVDIARDVGASHPGEGEQRAVWLDYARWLVAALTFQLAADIAETSFSQTWDGLGRLAVVAVVPLGHFLDREMEHTAKLQAVGRSEMRAAGSPRDD